MPSPLRAIRRLATAAAAAAVVAVPLLPAAAQADDAGRTVVGTLVQAWPETRHDEHGSGDADDTAAAQPLTWVETEDGAVRVPTDDVAGVPTGTTVEVALGAEVGDEAAEQGFGPAQDVLDASVLGNAPGVGALPAAPAGTATNRVTVALAAPAGAARDGVLPGDVAAAVGGPVADFWREQTGGAVDLAVEATHDWIDTTAGCSDPTALWDEVAARAGWQGGPRRHLLVYVSSAAADCAYGLAEVGARPASGGRAYVRELLPSLLAHELGHNFGLGHSSALHCEGTDTGGCRTAPYRDHYDVMGASWERTGSLNVVQARALGLLPRGAVRTVPADGRTTTVRLAPLTGGAGVRAVRLPAADGRDYWLELRTAAGRDAWIGTSDDRWGLEAGVLLRRTGGWPDTSLLLDPTPTAGRAGDPDVALPAGAALPLDGGRFTVTVTAPGPTGAAVEIRSTGGSVPAPPPADPAVPEVLPGGEGPAGATAIAPAPAPVPAPQPEMSTAPAELAAAEVPAAEPAVTPASDVRSLAVPAGAGVVLGASGWLAGRRVLRARALRGALPR